MLLSRRQEMAAASCAATLAAIGITAADTETSRPAARINRELRLAISDGFSRQSWTRGGETWTETRDTLSMLEDECVRVVVINDTPGVRIISFGADRPLLRIRPGEAQTFDLLVDRVEMFEIAVVGQPPLSRPVKVRPNYGAHPNLV